MASETTSHIIATWNVNSVKARADNIANWLDEFQPDVLVMQEIKTIDENFPTALFEERQYHLLVHGQKSYNGVAIASRHPITETYRGLPGNEADPQARFLQARIHDEQSNYDYEIACLYLPNGNPVWDQNAETGELSLSEKYRYKLDWMQHLYHHMASELAQEKSIMFAGDYNICPLDMDVYDPAGWADDALCRPDSRAAYRKLCHLGYQDAFRALHSETAYSFWDYQAGAWQKDNGLRIDHLLLSPLLTNRLLDADIDRGPRGQQKASDHTPAWCRIRVS